MTPDIERARAVAQAIVRDFGVKAPPVAVERIIKARGILLQYAPLEEDLSGMAYIKDGIGIIGVNALHHHNRQRFSAAHELGHHELHAAEITKAIHVDKKFNVLYRDSVSSQGVDRLEIEANAFASELLIPEGLLATLLGTTALDIEDDEGIDALARRFKVSAAAMRFRLTGRL